MNTPTCKKCQYYVQHYTIIGRKFVSAYCGHCSFSRTKRKLPDAKACDHFLPGTEPADKFVSKEYLTKKLLHYVLSLDLLSDDIMEDEKENMRR